MSSIEINLQGQVALVTGGSRGIGRAIALRLAEAGAHVAINYLRQRTAAEETVAAIRALGRQALAIRANVGEHEAIEEMVGEIQKEFGRLDILVSNAASGVLKPALELTEKHWHWTMDINAGTLLPLTQHAVPLMGDRGGHIIAVSSLGSVRAIPNYAAVGASKAALESLVRHLALELAPHVHVNCLLPGFTTTEDVVQRFRLDDPQARAAILSTSPMGKFAGVEDIARAALFLASDLSDYMTGQLLCINGGSFLA